MTTTSPDMPTTWRVVSQISKYDYGPNGSPAPGFQITFVTGAGNQGSVFIANSQYSNTALVKQAIAAQASQVDLVGSLTHES